MSIETIKIQTVKQVESLLKSIPQLLGSFQTILDAHFTSFNSPSELQATYEATLSTSPDAINILLIAALSDYKDLLASTISHIQLLERYIIVHVPKMEDGNNFGVTVQMTVAKALQETRTSLLSKLDAITLYYKERAEAVEKLALVKVTKTSSKTSSLVESTKEEEKKESNTISSDEKKVEVQDKVTPFRMMHLVAMDVAAFYKAKAGVESSLNEFIMVLDNVEKNKSKLTTPKGSGGGRPHMGMY
jgi:hypothetical protein